MAKSRRLRGALLLALLILAGLVLYDRVLGPAAGRQSPGPPAPANESAVERSTARVVAAADGDTIRLDSGERVRYLGIDTPELGNERVAPQAFAAQAAERNRQLVAGKSVQLETDAEDRDRFGRLLRHVWLDNELIAATLIREGLGFAQLVPPNSKHRERLEAAEQEARSAQRGLWSQWPTPAPVFLTPVKPALLPLNNPRSPECPPDIVPAPQARGLVGQAATVCVRDVRVQKGTDAIFLRPRQATAGGLTLVLFRDIWPQLPTTPERHFEQRTVVARGRVELFEGAPEIVVRDFLDLRIVD
jgi:micrococcal nuclease